MSGEAVEYVRGIPVVKMFQQTVYSFKAFYAAIRDYSDLASQYAHELQGGTDLLPDFYQRGVRPPDPGGASAGLRRRYPGRAGQFYLLCPVRPPPAAR